MENTDEIIRLVAKEAIKEFDKEQKEKKKFFIWGDREEKAW